MASPVQEDRPLRRSKRVEKPRRALTSREQRQKKTQFMVTWFLAFVFGITSVGFMIGFRADSGRGSAQGPQTDLQRLEGRLKAEQEASAAHPEAPQYHYSQSTTYLELAQQSAMQGKADEAKGYQAKAIEQLQQTLKLSPGHNAALKQLSAYYVGEGKFQEAATYLTDGIKAETAEIERRKKAVAAAGPSPSPAPEAVPPPDVDLRALLFTACIEAQGKEAQAEEAAKEGFLLNPKDFLEGQFGVGGTLFNLQVKGQPATYARAQQILEKAAVSPAAKVQLQGTMVQINAFLAKAAAARAKASPAPSGAPAASSPAPVGSPAPAGSPEASSAPVAAPSGIATPGAAPAASPVPPTGGEASPAPEAQPPAASPMTEAPGGPAQGAPPAPPASPAP